MQSLIEPERTKTHSINHDDHTLTTVDNIANAASSQNFNIHIIPAATVSEETRSLHIKKVTKLIGFTISSN